jgi:hypothetical protein
MPGFSDVCDLLQKHVPYGDPHSYDFPTMTVVVGDPPNSDDPTTRTCVNVFSALRDFGDKPPCPQGRLQVQLVNGVAVPTPQMPITDPVLDTKSLHLVFKSGGTAYRITKGLRIPYTYQDVNHATVHTNMFILYSGAGQS